LTREDPDRYRVESELGAGGIGQVYLVRDTHLAREVAVKQLLTPASNSKASPQRRKAFQRDRRADELRLVNEARITGQLEHPGIVPVYELGQRDDGSIYYAMRLVRGRTFARALDQGDLQQRLELLPHFIDLCNAVAYAHSRGVLHRDIKSENVM